MSDVITPCRNVRNRAPDVVQRLKRNAAQET